MPNGRAWGEVEGSAIAAEIEEVYKFV